MLGRQLRNELYAQYELCNCLCQLPYSFAHCKKGRPLDLQAVVFVITYNKLISCTVPYSANDANDCWRPVEYNSSLSS